MIPLRTAFTTPLARLTAAPTAEPAALAIRLGTCIMKAPTLPGI